MEKSKFIDILQNKAKKIDINLTIGQCEKFYTYMNLLIEWNNKINLTAITEPTDIILKHFIDCLIINKHIKSTDKIADIGTGAGFPGIPLKIYNNNLNIDLIDSLNKRLIFIKEVINKTQLGNINIIHSRAEELAHNKEYREKYDVIVSRAVAPLNILLEYTLPFIKKGGKCICMKGSNVQEEIANCKNALEKLGGKIEIVEEKVLPDTDIVRAIVIISKIKETSIKYPRKAGMPSKEPL